MEVLKTSQKVCAATTLVIAGFAVISIGQWLMGAADIGAALAVWIPEQK